MYVNSRHTGTTATAFDGLAVNATNNSDSTGPWNLWAGIVSGAINYGSGAFLSLSGVYVRAGNHGTSLTTTMAGVDSNLYNMTAGTVTNFRWIPISSYGICRGSRY
jgi:hypothetical protein